VDNYTRKTPVEARFKRPKSLTRMAEVVSILLLASVLQPVLYAPHAYSQNYTTLTYTTYATGTSTLTQYSQIASTISRLTTSTFVTTQTVPGRQDNCYHFAYQLHADPTGKVIGSISTDFPIDFYIMTEDQYNEFMSLTCISEFDSVLVQKDITSYSLQWTPPDSGNYYLVFHNRRDSTASLTLRLATTEHLTEELYSTVSIVQQITLTQTRIVLQPLSATWLTPGILAAALIVLAAIVIAAIIVWLNPKRRNGN